MNSIVKTLLKPVGTVFSFLIQGKEYHLNLLCSERISLQNPLNGMLTGVLGTVTLTHELHDQVTSDNLYHLFTNTGGSGRAYFIVDIQTCADDWRVSNSPMHFVSETACGTGAGK